MKKNSNSKFIKILLITASLLLLLFLSRGFIYQAIFSYEDAGSRKNYKVKDEKLADYINQSLPNDESLDDNITIDMIIDITQEITAKTLSYSSDGGERDPKKMHPSIDTDCSGYASFASAIANYILKRHGLDNEWEASPRKAKLYLFGNDMSKGAKTDWFKNHDIIILKSKSSGREIYIDPVVYDYFGVATVNKLSK